MSDQTPLNFHGFWRMANCPDSNAARTSGGKKCMNLMKDHVKQRMTNPFDVASHPKSLVNISTGFHAPTEIEVALTNAFDNGINMVKASHDEIQVLDLYVH
jgi:hypothetical protein